MSSLYPLLYQQNRRHFQYFSKSQPRNITRILFFYITSNFLISSTVNSSSVRYYKNDRVENINYPYYEQRRMVCNNDTDYQCVCRVGIPEILNEPNIIECDQFIQSRELPVVDMRLRHVNLEAHLHTNEKYETYFKRRIASIVSSYCEHQTNECLGTTLALTKRRRKQRDSEVMLTSYTEGKTIVRRYNTTSDASQSDDDGYDKSVLYAADDESEPLLTQNNVVLLRVEREPINVTRILFAITRSENVGSLNEQMIIDPVKVKYILGSQAGPLARILGGIKLDSVRVSRIRRHLNSPEANNTKLITIISAVGTFFIICYIIGAIRLCRDARLRRLERKSVEDAHKLATVTSNTVPNYGSCQHEQSKNGTVLNMTNLLKEVMPSNNHENDECLNSCQQQSHILTEHQARLMFMCDPSQLPREPTCDFQSSFDNNDLPLSTKSSNSFREEVVIKNEQLSQKAINSASRNSSQTVISDHSHNTNPDTLASMHNSLILSDSFAPPDNSLNGPKNQYSCFENEGENNPAIQFKSKSTSRIGDDIHNARDFITLRGKGNNPLNLSAQDLRKGACEKKRESEMTHWSSGEGEMEIYYKLSDDDDLISSEDWPNQTMVASQNSISGNKNYDSDSETENDEQLPCGGEMESYVYERLREESTPIPPPDS
ncbi:hypothetical protein DICVIV_00644 [Dictyocaulus viviparus]|uniref:Uncharacterized protein n=1 Tax=Dictyocaulus viviparus TaxID=29172 RepID=A0A0D8YER5_DICVI|nr:hypothetical protein DICVIV_00644 [Dictyocaulus viviparus]